jgi:hypothetical protein
MKGPADSAGINSFTPMLSFVNPGYDYPALTFYFDPTQTPIANDLTTNSWFTAHGLIADSRHSNFMVSPRRLYDEGPERQSHQL